jgi:hypothetical protein
MREVYGDNVASEITGLCNNKAILRLESPPSARWASELFGKAELIERRESVSRSQTSQRILPGWNRSISEQRLTTDSVLGSEIMTLPTASPENGFHGLFITRERGAYRKALPWGRIVLNGRLCNNGVVNFLPRPIEEQYLKEWEAKDMTRLDLENLESVSSPFSEGEIIYGKPDLTNRLRSVREK